MFRKLNLINLKYLVLIAILLLVLFLPYKNKNNIPGPIGKDVKISVALQPAFALIYVADKKGFFNDEGLNVTFNKHLLGRDALNEVVEGRSDLATVFDVAALNSINNGNEISILTSLHSSDKNHVLTSFGKIGIDDISDLKGKKVAITRGTSTEFFLYSLLVTDGFSLNDVETVDTEPNRLISSLENGSVDAAVLFNPYNNQFKNKYKDTDYDMHYSETYHEASLLTGKKEYVESNKDTVIKILKALYKAEEFIKENEQEALGIVDDWLENLNRQEVEETWGIFKVSLELNNRLLTQMEQVSRFFSHRGLYEREIPHLRQYFVIDHLKSVKPLSVTMF